MKFVVLSSSRGTTFQSVINALKDGSLKAECLGLIADRADRGCIEKAKAAGLPCQVVPRTKDEDREAYDKKIHKLILTLGKPDFIACMGWMWIFSPWFIRTWKNKIINVHPALLPKFGGEGMYGHHVHEAVLRECEKESGMTIHLMDEGVDTGAVLLQEICPVLKGDTAETLQKRVQELEVEAFPKVLQMIELGEISIDRP